MMLKSGMDNLDIKEWRMELRENDLCLEEGNIMAKRLKLKDVEENYEEQKQQQEEEKKEIEEKRKSVEGKEVAIANEQENLRRLQFEVGSTTIFERCVPNFYLGQ